MGDLPRPLGHPQDQVPVLGALELGVEAADLLDQRAAQDAEVAGVHLGPEPLRRPVGLEERPRVAPALVDLVFVGVDVVDLGVGAQRLLDQRERVGMERVVVVEEDDELAARHRQRVVGGGDDAAVLPRGGRPGSGRPRGRRASTISQHLRVGRAVVDEAELPVAEALAAHRVEHRPKDSRRGFVDRRQDREAGGGQPAQPRPPRRCEIRRARRPGSFTRLTRWRRTVSLAECPASSSSWPFAAPSSASFSIRSRRSRSISSVGRLQLRLRHRRRVYPARRYGSRLERGASKRPYLVLRAASEARIVLWNRTGKSSGCWPLTWP